MFLSDFLSSYCSENEIKIPEVTSKNKLKKYILEGNVLVNQKVISNHRLTLNNGDVIFLEKIDESITFNKKLTQSSEKDMSNQSDISDEILPGLELQEILNFNEPKKSAVLLNYYNRNRDNLSRVEESNIKTVFDRLIANHGLAKHLNLDKQDMRWLNNLINKFNQEKNSRVNKLIQLSVDIQNFKIIGVDKLQGDYNRLLTKPGYKYLVQPLLPSLFSQNAISSLFSRINKAQNLSNEEEKQQYYHDEKEIFERFKNCHLESSGYISKKVLDTCKLICNCFFDYFTFVCQAEEIESCNVEVRLIDRNYIINESSNYQEFFILVINDSKGIARNISFINNKENQYFN